MKDYSCRMCHKRLIKEQSKKNKEWYLFSCKKCILAWAVREYKGQGVLLGF